METKQLKAVVAGDVTVDWLEWPVAARHEGLPRHQCHLLQQLATP